MKEISTLDAAKRVEGATADQPHAVDARMVRLLPSPLPLLPAGRNRPRMSASVSLRMRMYAGMHEGCLYLHVTPRVLPLLPWHS